jgi:hypothetical protein
LSLLFYHLYSLYRLYNSSHQYMAITVY